jgi:hypothetical protein
MVWVWAEFSWLSEGRSSKFLRTVGKFRLPDRRMSSSEGISTEGFLCLYTRIHAKVEEASCECSC